MASDKSRRKAIEDSFTAREQDEHFERALGRMMIAWADVEAELYRVLVHYSGVSDAVARALFSGTRGSAAMAFIQSIAHNTGMESARRDDLDYVFEQAKAINTMRDHLAHHSSGTSIAFDDPMKRIVANTRASRYGKAQGYEIGADGIDAMTHDLHGIHNHLNMHWGPRTGPFRPWREDPNVDVPTVWSFKAPPPIAPFERAPEDPRKTKPRNTTVAPRRSRG